MVITIFSRVVCPDHTSIPTFQNLAKQNNFQTRIVMATGGTVGLAAWIIDGTMSSFSVLPFSCIYSILEEFPAKISIPHLLL